MDTEAMWILGIIGFTIIACVLAFTAGDTLVAQFSGSDLTAIMPYVVGVVIAIAFLRFIKEVLKKRYDARGKVQKKEIERLQADLGEARTDMGKFKRQMAEMQEQIADLYIQQHDQREK